jgi:hypothetical protein
MKRKRLPVLPIILVAGLLVVGGLVFYVATKPKAPVKPTQQETSLVDESLPENTEVAVTLIKSKTKDNTVVLNLDALGKKYQSVAYELTYDSNGILKGVNSGSKPIELVSLEKYEKEVYMGTCSKNVCKPDAGVKSVSVALEFTNSSGQKSQFMKDFQL